MPSSRILLLLLGLISLGGSASAQVVVQNFTYPTGQTTPVSSSTTIDAHTAVTVPSAATVTFQAGTRITLGPGFTAASGSAFHAYISGGGGGGDTQPPTAPTGLAGSATATSATLSWNASTDNVAVAGYRIYRVGTTLPVGTTTTLGFTDLGLSSNTTYTYTVVAYDAADNVSSPSNALSVTTEDPDTPDPDNPAELKIHTPIAP